VRIQPLVPLGEVVPGSAAAAAGFVAGDEIRTLDGEPVKFWRDVLVALYTVSEEDAAAQKATTFTFGVERDGTRRELELVRPPLKDLDGWESGLRLADTRLGLVQKGGPADRVGLQRGDRIVEIAGTPVKSFEKLAEIVRRSGGQEITVVWERDGTRMRGTVVPEVVEVAPDSTQGRLAIERNFVHRSVGIFEAVRLAAQNLWYTTATIVRGIYSLIAGGLGLEAVGGPIRIAQMAGEMLRWSFDYLVAFIAFFSVNLFLLNLLPIPVLDGGHVVFLLYELVRGRPAPERLQAIATQMGLILLLLFMTFVVVLELWQVTGH
jgi:regulator of sigma E protease